jgi:Iron-containing redox enzyme
MPRLPSPRGPISEQLLLALTGEVVPLGVVDPGVPADPLADEDLQLALYLCYELHYRGLPGVDDRWEWEPSLLRLRGKLEDLFERGLLAAVPLTAETIVPEDMDLALREIAEADGPSLSAFIGASAGAEHVREFVVHRSAYQLKEADPHSWAIPRLAGPAKAALLEVQFDEYGRGRAERIHAEMFARAMRALGLDGTYGAYLDHIPGVTLATVNLMSMLGLHRRWRGAIVGHLALFEMTSSIPNRRYATGLRRLGFGEDATAFFDEHVVADAVHENIAAVDLAGGLVRQEPTQCGGVLWGARALSHLDSRWAGRLLECWQDGWSSLRTPLPAGLPARAERRPEAGELVSAVAEGLDLRGAAPA